VGFVVLVVIGAMLGDSGSSSPPPPPPATTPIRTLTAPPPPVPGAQWSYATGTDEMTGKSTSSAAVQSSNSVELDFPYHNPQRGTLTIRRHPRHGPSAIFTLERGQLPCSSYDGCSIMVRFDEKEAVRYSASPPEDNRSEVLFINDEVRFLTFLTLAKRVRVFPNIYQNGGLVFDFDVTGFDLERLKAQ
jgi:hypothetical protein